MDRASTIAFGLALAALLRTSEARAQTSGEPSQAPASAPAVPASPKATPTPAAWPYPLFRPAEYVTTGVVGATAIVVYFVATPQTNVHWQGGILFDNAVRSAVELHSQSARTAVRTASNVTAVGAEAFAIGVDSFLVPIAGGHITMAEQLVLMDAEAYAFSSLLTTTAFDLTGRARPSYADCQKNPNYDILCNSAPTASFWSGHTAEAFTGAGLSCAHHAYAHIYGDPTADVLGCTGMILLGSATGMLRLMGDRHYATDVMAGAIVGFGFGYGIPTMLHYAWPWGGKRAEAISASLAPMTGGLGLRLGGTF